MKQENLVSQSETIGVLEMRKLSELNRTLLHMLTQQEFLAIVGVYKGVIDRLVAENGVGG
ncbi:hypothetical protein [Anaerotignum sp. MB30-C6]|uniref:hypothetical protein n=1 Tax=Anaerotignum sp. MB30-C6 TaxID=3070814 RepID=UPI0027DC7495|nr:hypothetical protein [Anaerotignum sp. MB30-C6]WMI81927.1 hypothetical protein RBQ60_04135 [Anaerotignum sp. MB30-C6]